MAPGPAQRLAVIARDGLLLALGFALVVAGADVLVRGGASLARRLGLTPLVVGLTVVAFGTSAPELLVSVGGAVQGHGDIALGNVVGSNIFNVGVILAISVLIAPVRIKLGVLRVDAPLMVASSLLAMWLAGFDVFPRWGGLLLLGLLVGYTVFSIRVARRQTDADIACEFEAAVPHATRSVWFDLLLVAGGLGLLILGSQVLVGAATAVARSLGLSEAVIGLTILAAGTSLPELATSVVAAIRRQPDIALGNVIGSNTFNLLGVLGLSATVQPFRAPSIGTTDRMVMVAYAVALLPLLWTGRRLQRWEGALLLAGYACYLWQLWPDR